MCKPETRVGNPRHQRENLHSEYEKDQFEEKVLLATSQEDSAGWDHYTVRSSISASGVGQWKTHSSRRSSTSAGFIRPDQ